MNSQQIRQLVLALPEIYQPVYGHPELWAEVSRTCEDRLETITTIYNAIASAVGRPLRVLDLGCAQGFFSFSLAALGATVHGVDFLDKNIAVCNAIAKENPQFKATFETGRIEAIISALQDGQHDIILGLSVFHHIVHEHGVEQVRRWLDHAANTSCALVLELALNTEPLYWAPSLPEDPRTLVNSNAFVHEVRQFSTHLSNVSRPMLVVSNRYWILDGHAESIENWSTEPHRLANGTHEGSRRYFWSKDHFVKLYYFNHERGAHNFVEFEREAQFLATEHSGFRAPGLLTTGSNNTEGWVAMERLRGKLLLDALNDNDKIDAIAILRTLLRQLAALESQGLYCSDIRTWNVMVLNDQSVRLIDLGSIFSVEEDCVWPKNIFLAFLIFVRELSTGKVDDPSLMRTVSISPFNLPAPFKNWAMKFWRLPTASWSFRNMLELLDDAPGPEEGNALTSADEVWAGAIESGLQEQKLIVQHLTNKFNSFQGQVRQDLGLLTSQKEHIKWLESEWEGAAEKNKELADAAKKERDRAEWFENEWNTAKDEVEKLRSASQYWEHKCNALGIELENTYKSKSWKITWPLRKAVYAGKQLSNSPTVAKERFKHIFQIFLKPSVRAAVGFISERPLLKTRILKVINRYPTLKSRLRALAISQYHPANGYSSPTSFNGSSSEWPMQPDYPSLSALNKLGAASNISSNNNQQELQDIQKTYYDELVRERNKKHASHLDK